MSIDFTGKVAIVTGSASLTIAAEEDAAESVLHADNVEIGMAPDGTWRWISESL